MEIALLHHAFGLLLPFATDDESGEGGFHGPSLEEFTPPSLFGILEGTPLEINRLMLIRFLVVAILLRSLDAMKVFEYVFATTRGGPGTETETLQFFVYQTGIQFFRLGSASSMAFIVLVVVLAIIVVAFRRMERAKQS